jgi:hypothetical protein
MENNEVIQQFMKAGWGYEQSGGGCHWLIKNFEDGLGGGFLAITDDGGVQAPESWDTPCILGIYDQDGKDLGFNIRSTAQNLYWLVTVLMKL